MKRLSTIIGPDVYREIGRDAEAEQVLRQVIAESPSRMPNGTHWHGQPVQLGSGD
jgi:Tfp pilus assembly protein FimV